MRPLDLEQFRLRREDKLKPTKAARPPRHRPGEWFVKGPIPGSWLVAASEASCTALRVGLALWYLAGVVRVREVKPTWSVWQRFGLSPDAGARGLAALEEAGLIEVKRAPGRCPVVTIQER